MALSFVGVGAAANGTTSLSLSAHASTQPGDLMLMAVVAKPYDSVLTTPGGWTLVEEATNGTTASGVDTGSTKVALYAKIASGPSGTIPFTATGSDVLLGAILTYNKTTTEMFSVLSDTSGGDSTQGTAYSATGSVDIGLVTDDWCFALAGVNSDVTHTAATVTATGITFGTANERLDATTTTGNDAGLVCIDRPVTAGTSSAAPVMTASASGTSSGTSIFLRLRTVTPTITATFNDSVDSPGFDIQLTSTTLSDVYGVSKFTILREDVNGDYPQEPVRGLQDADPTVEDGSDYECPFVSQVEYRYSAYNADGAVYAEVVSATLTPDYVRDAPGSPVELITSNFYIKDIGNPVKSLAVAMGEIESYDVEGNILGTYHVLGRSKPVVYTDVMGARKGSFTVYASVDDIGGTIIHSAKEHRTLFETGDVLLLQSVKYPVDLRDMYFVVDGYSEKVLNRPAGGGLWIEFNVQFVEVDRPLTLDMPLSTATWQDLYDDPAFSSWTDVNAAGTTWLEILQRYV